MKAWKRGDKTLIESLPVTDNDARQLNVTRRVLLQGGLSSIALAGFAGNATAESAHASGRALDTSEYRVLRRPSTTAVALQWTPGKDGLMQHLHSVVRGVGRVDLLVVGRPSDHAYSVSDAQAESFSEFARESGCTLILPTQDTDSFYVCLPSGTASLTRTYQGSILETDVGTLAIVSGGKHSQASTSWPVEAVDILIRYETAGYAASDARALSAMANAFSIVVTTPKNDSAPTDAGTAIYAPDGNILTQTNGVRSQAITAKLRVSELRKTRETLLHTVV